MFFSPNTKAKITTMSMPMPLMPAFDIPKRKTAKRIEAHCRVDRL